MRPSLSATILWTLDLEVDQVNSELRNTIRCQALSHVDFSLALAQGCDSVTPKASPELALVEVCPGDNIGLLASKLTSTPIRGQLYGIAAAWCKVGAFVRTYIFTILTDAAEDDKVKRGQYPFWVSSSLCIFSAAVAFFGLPNVGQDMVEEEDERFKTYLEEHGYDTSDIGTKKFREEASMAMH
ncbi:glycerophosphoinositol permease [Exophiala xenobiotica]